VRPGRSPSQEQRFSGELREVGPLVFSGAAVHGVPQSAARLPATYDPVA
jgi:hypothetical protein